MKEEYKKRQATAKTKISQRILLIAWHDGMFFMPKIVDEIISLEQSKSQEVASKFYLTEKSGTDIFNK